MTELEATTYCAVHPDRETGLRCITCNRLMCVDCAVRTPVGYRCRECVRGLEDKFFKANPADDVIAGAVCAGISAVAVGLLSLLPFGIWIAIIAGLPVGGAISEAALRATGRRRSRFSHIIAPVSAAIGGLVGVGVLVMTRYYAAVNEAVERAGARGIEVPPLTLDRIAGAVFSDIGTLLLIGMITLAVYWRYR